MEKISLDDTAQLVVALDTLHLELQSSLTQTTQLWSTRQRALADLVLDELCEHPDTFEVSAIVRQALGGNFASGPVISAALRADLLTYGGTDGKVLMEQGKNGLLDRIEEAFQ